MHMHRGRRFGSAEAADATRDLEIAWATLRHDGALYQTGGVTDRVHLCQATCGHLGCAMPQCTVLSTEEQVANAIAHIDALADGAWLVYDLARARTNAIAAVAQSVAATMATQPVVDGVRDERSDAMRSAAYRAWRPYVDMIHQLHGRLWGAYAPFWGLVSRTGTEPLLGDPFLGLATPTPSFPHGPPTPRDLEASFLTRDMDDPSATTPTTMSQTNMHRPDNAAVCEIPWMEVDQGACMATVARLRAVALARRIARDATYPLPEDTAWATGRRALAAALGASPDTRMVLAIKDRRHVLADGSHVTSRKVSLRADLAVCPFTILEEEEEEEEEEEQVQTAEHARSRRQGDFGHYSIVACAHNHTAATGVTHDRIETLTNTDAERYDQDRAARSHTQGRHSRINPTIACMQRLCVGKYMLDGWLARIARGSRHALHTITLLNTRASPTTYSRPARRGDFGFCATSPHAIGRVTVVRRQIALDGCLVAILVRDAYIVQPAVRAAEARLFVATDRPSAMPPTPDRALNRRAASDAIRLLNGHPRTNMSARRALAALRYATWYACGAGQPDGYDAGLVTSLLDRAGFHPTRGLVARLVLLWSP